MLKEHQYYKEINVHKNRCSLAFIFYKLFSEFPKMHTSLFLRAEM